MIRFTDYRVIAEKPRVGQLRVGSKWLKPFGYDVLYYHAKSWEDRTTRAGCRCENMVFDTMLIAGRMPQSVKIYLRFNGHFPGELGLAGVYWSKGWWKWWLQLELWSCKAPVKSSPVTSNKPIPSFYRPDALPVAQPCQSTEGKNITFHGLAYPKLTWGLPTLSLTTNSSWLPWERFAMPLISPLMPVPQLLCFLLEYNICCHIWYDTIWLKKNSHNDYSPKCEWFKNVNVNQKHFCCITWINSMR